VIVTRHATSVGRCMMNDSTVKPDLAKTIQLLTAAQSGDEQALNELYARYGDRLLAVVRLRLGRHLRSKLESCDILQDAMLASLRHIHDAQFSSNGAFFHWLSKLIENRIRDQADYFSAKRRDAARENSLQAAGPTTGSVFGPIAELGTSDTPSQSVVRREDLERLEAVIDTLAHDQKEALLLVRYEGMKHAEAGEAMKRSPDAVRMLVARALVQLGKQMGTGTS